MTQDLDPCLAAPLAPAPLQEWLLHAMARAEHAGKSPSCIPAMRSGFAELDPLLTGQRLVAVVGPPAVGKTALGLRIAHETSRGAHVLYATTMSESTALTTRLLSEPAGLPLGARAGLKGPTVVNSAGAGTPPVSRVQGKGGGK